MFRLSTLCASVALLAFASTAGAISAAQLTQLEKRLEGLNAYHQANCQGTIIARDCSRVEAGIDQFTRAIEQLTGCMQQEIAGAAFERTIELSGTSNLHRQYNEHVAQLQAVNSQIEQMQRARVSPNDARLRALQNDASVLHMRLLRLQSRLKGTS